LSRRRVHPTAPAAERRDGAAQGDQALGPPQPGGGRSTGPGHRAEGVQAQPRPAVQELDALLQGAQAARVIEQLEREATRAGAHRLAAAVEYQVMCTCASLSGALLLSKSLPSLPLVQGDARAAQRPPHTPAHLFSVSKDCQRQWGAGKRERAERKRRPVGLRTAADFQRQWEAVGCGQEREREQSASGGQWVCGLLPTFATRG
jgi:hypothetical protein